MIARRGALVRSYPSFGRRPVVQSTHATPTTRLADDARLFALTFAGGFLFMSVYLA